MKYKFGDKSQDELNTAHKHLRAVAHVVLEIKDHSILKGHRNEQEQNAAFNAVPQRSKLKYPHGKHNGLPSMALDVQTYPRQKGDTAEETNALLIREQLYLLGLYKGVAHVFGYDMRTGGDWDMDGEISDNTWNDLFHVELRDNDDD